MDRPQGNLIDLNQLYPGKFTFPHLQAEYPFLCHKDFRDADGGSIKRDYGDVLFAAKQIDLHTVVEGLQGLFSLWPNWNLEPEKEANLKEIVGNEKWEHNKHIQNPSKVFIRQGTLPSGTIVSNTYAAVDITEGGFVCLIGGVVRRYKSLQDLKNDVLDPERDLLIIPFPYLEIAHYYRKPAHQKSNVEITGPVNAEKPLAIITFMKKSGNIVQMNPSTFVKYATSPQEANVKVTFVRDPNPEESTNFRRKQYFYLRAIRPIKKGEKILLSPVDFDAWTRNVEQEKEFKLPTTKQPSKSKITRKPIIRKPESFKAVKEDDEDAEVAPSPIAGRLRSKTRRQEKETEKLPSSKRSKTSKKDSKDIVSSKGEVVKKAKEKEKQPTPPLAQQPESPRRDVLVPPVANSARGYLGLPEFDLEGDVTPLVPRDLPPVSSPKRGQGDSPASGVFIFGDKQRTPDVEKSLGTPEKKSTDDKKQAQVTTPRPRTSAEKKIYYGETFSPIRPATAPPTPSSPRPRRYTMEKSLQWPAYPYFRGDRGNGGELVTPKRAPPRPFGVPTDVWDKLKKVPVRRPSTQPQQDYIERLWNQTVANRRIPLPSRMPEFLDTNRNPWMKETNQPWWLLQLPTFDFVTIHHPIHIIVRHGRDTVEMLQDFETFLSLHSPTLYLSPAFGLLENRNLPCFMKLGLILYDKTMVMDKNAFDRFIGKCGYPNPVKRALAKSRVLGAWQREARPGLDMDTEMNDLSKFMQEFHGCEKVWRLVDASESELWETLGEIRDLADRLVYHNRCSGIFLPFVIFSSISSEREIMMHGGDGKLTNVFRGINHYLGAHDSSPQNVFPSLVWCMSTGHSLPEPVNAGNVSTFFFRPTVLGSAATPKQLLHNMEYLVNAFIRTHNENSSTSGTIDLHNVGCRNNFAISQRTSMTKQREDQISKPAWGIDGPINQTQNFPVSVHHASVGLRSFGRTTRGLHILAAFSKEFLVHASIIKAHAQEIMNMCDANQVTEHVLISNRDHLFATLEATTAMTQTKRFVLIVSSPIGSDTSFLIGNPPFVATYARILRMLKQKLPDLESVMVVANHGQGIDAPRTVHVHNRTAVKKVSTADAQMHLFDLCQTGSYLGRFVNFPCACNYVPIANRLRLPGHNQVSWGMLQEDAFNQMEWMRSAVINDLGEQQHLEFPNEDDYNELDLVRKFDEVTTPSPVTAVGTYRSIPSFQTSISFLYHDVIGGKCERLTPSPKKAILPSPPSPKKATIKKTPLPPQAGAEQKKISGPVLGQFDVSNAPGIQEQIPGPSKASDFRDVEENQESDVDVNLSSSDSEERIVPVIKFETDAEFRATVAELFRNCGDFTTKHNADGQLESIKTPLAMPKEIHAFLNGPLVSTKIEVMGIPISIGDLRCLLPGNELSGDIIDIYLRLISSANANNADYPPLVTVEFNYLLRKIDTLPQRILETFAYLYEDGAIAAFPMYYSKHWALGMYFTRSNEVILYNSLASHQIKNKRKLAIKKLLTTVFGELNTGSPAKQMTTEGLRFVDGNLAYQQNNTSDCGVAVCQVALQVSRNQNALLVQSNMDALRYRMILEILQEDLLNF